MNKEDRLKYTCLVRDFLNDLPVASTIYPNEIVKPSNRVVWLEVVKEIMNVKNIEGWSDLEFNAGYTELRKINIDYEYINKIQNHD